MSKEQELKEMLKLYSKQDLWNRIKEKQATIYELKAKLVEKDAERELDNSFWKQECDSLQKQLAEKEKNALALFSALYDILEEQDPENVSSRIDYLTKQNNGAISDFYKEHKVLKQKLEEKDKEIEYQESMKILAVENQNKKAIEQLEKVKDFAEKVDGMWLDMDCVINYIDDQINELKEIK